MFLVKKQRLQGYHISSKDGQYHGLYHGLSPAHALLGMLRDDGFGPGSVWLNRYGDDVVYAANRLDSIAGYVSDWDIQKANC